MIRVRLNPSARAASTYSSLLQAEEARPHDAADRQPPGDAEDDDDRVLAAPEHGGDGDGEDDVRDRQEDVDDAHDAASRCARRRSPATAPNATPMSSASTVDEDADLQRHAGAVDDAGEHVAAERVGAEPVVARRTLAEVAACAPCTPYGVIHGAKMATSTRRTMNDQPDERELVLANRPTSARSEGSVTVGTVSIGRRDVVSPPPRRMRGSNHA